MNKVPDTPPLVRTVIVSSDFDQFVNEVAMKFWNQVALIPHFQHLEPQDYPQVYEAIRKVLKPYKMSPAKPSDAHGA